MVEEKLELFLELVNERGPQWKEKHRDDIKVVEQKEDGEGLIQMRATAIYPDVDVDTIMKIQTDFELRRMVDKVSAKFKTFKSEFEDRVIYAYGRVRLPFGISNRDFCVKRVVLENIAGYDNIVLQYSIEHPDYPPILEAVRAQHRILAAGAKKLGPNRTEIHMANEIDMGVSEAKCSLFGLLLYRGVFRSGLLGGLDRRRSSLALISLGMWP